MIRIGIICIACAATLIQGTAGAQESYDAPAGYGESCSPQQRRCGPYCRGECIEKHVYIPVPPKKPGAPEGGEAPEGGAYAAPPSQGTVAGETRSVGIEGLSLEFPAFKLKMPTLKLPALTRYRQGPRMLTEGGVAPMVGNVRNEYSVPAGGGPEGGRVPASPEGGRVPEGGGPPQKPEGGYMPEPCAPPYWDEPAQKPARLPPSAGPYQHSAYRTPQPGQLAGMDAELQWKLQQLEQSQVVLQDKMERLTDCLEKLVAHPQFARALADDTPASWSANEGLRDTRPPANSVRYATRSVERTAAFVAADPARDRPLDQSVRRLVPPVP